jgi:hypothetical protein
MFGLAKLTPTATKHTATVDTMVFVFMSLLIDKQIFGLIGAGAILAVRGAFEQPQVSRNIGSFEEGGD